MAVNAHWTGTVTADLGFTGGPINYGLDTGTTDAYIVNLSPAVASLKDGMLLSFTALNGNTVSAPTLTVNGITKTIANQQGGLLSAGDITGYTPCFLIFAEQQDYWMLLNANVSIATPYGIQFANYISGVDTAVVADAYNVELAVGVVGFYSPSYGSQVTFFPNTSNTGPSTLVVNGQGPSNIILQNGQTLQAGMLLSTKAALLTFGANNAGVLGWILTNPQGTSTAGIFGNITISGNTIISTNTNGNIGITPNGNGGTMIGTQTAITGLAYSLQIATSNQVPLLVLGSYKNTNGGFQERFYKSRSTTIGSFSAVSSGDKLAELQFYGDDGAAFRQSANITVTAQGTISSGVVPGQIVIQTANTSGTLTNALTIDNAQVCTFANAIVSSNGISFGGTTLANYVQSTFTPVFSAATVGDLSVVYTTQSGAYTRIGNMIFGRIFLNCTPTFSTASGDFRITGLPFTVGAYDGGGPVLVLQGATPPSWPASHTSIAAMAVSGTTYVVLVTTGSGQNGANLQMSNFTSAAQVAIEVNFSYCLT